MLVPVIGLVQVGLQARADRYTYLPQIGLSLAATWLAADLCESRAGFRRVLAAAAAVWLLILAFAAGSQVAFWHDSESLWAHALQCRRATTWPMTIWAWRCFTRDGSRKP